MTTEITPPFNLEQFKAGRAAVTRSGTTVPFIGHDPGLREMPPVLYRTQAGGVMGVYEDGLVSRPIMGMSAQSRPAMPGDLVGMAPVTTTMYANIYPQATPGVDGLVATSMMYDSAEAARRAVDEFDNAVAVAVPVTFSPLP